MEYLDGIDLQELVETFGPQPEIRVIHILKQICGSLSEAHSLGLVHRDIKPANIVLSRRGGQPDVVKVLDFGLVRALDQDKQSGMTAAGALTGTPLYMSPEAIQMPGTVDGRSDLYAVGAVGYFLLTGQPVFSAESIVDLCQMHVSAAPPTMTEVPGVVVSSLLESAILSCLEKTPSGRPATARALISRLEQAEVNGSWSYEEANIWWDQKAGTEATRIASQAEQAEGFHGETLIANSLTETDTTEQPTRRPR